jgi:glycosyltransferase involved in cell wall biosynthesis
MKEGGTRLLRVTKEVTDYPLVSVITVTYNADKFIKNCIESLSTQSYPHIEHIILDGGSSDCTVEILSTLNQHIVYWRSEPDEGIYHAMNKAVKYAKGEWVLFLGADDTLLPGFSDLAYLLKDKNCIYYGDSQWEHIIYGGKFNAYRLAKFNICHQSIFYPKGVFDLYEYKTDYIVNADHYLNIQCFTNNRFRFEYHPIKISVYGAGGFSSINEDIQFRKDKDGIVKSNFSKTVYLRYKLRKFRHIIKGRKSF